MRKCAYKVFFAAILAVLLTVAFAAAENPILIIPDSVTEIEENAFAGLKGVSGVLVPKGVKRIAEGALPGVDVYGFPNGAADAYARDHSLRFISIQIENASLTADAGWVQAGDLVTATMNAECAYPTLTYSFRAEDESGARIESGAQTGNTYSFVFAQSGEYAIEARAYHKWDAAERVLSYTVTVVEPIRVTTDSALIGVGETLTLIDETETRTVTLTSDNPQAVRAEGASVIGVALGRANITAISVTPEGTLTKTIPVEVVIPVEKIEVSLSANALPVGGSATASAAVTPWTATYRDIIWSSNDPSVASVDANGVVTPLKKGDCEIIAEAGGKTGRAALRVVVLTREIALTPEPGAPDPVYTKNIFSLIASASPEEADDPRVTWASANENVAMVDANGRVTCVGAGQTVITATAADGGGAKGQYTLTVMQGAESILLTGEKSLLCMDERLPLTADIIPSTAVVRAIVWTSSNEAIARVDDRGLVTPVSTGSVKITATAHNGVFAQYALTVVERCAPTSISISPSEAYVKVGGASTLIITATPVNAYESVYWSSSHTNVARVSASGVVTGVSAGAATITAVSTEDARVVATARVVVLSDKRTLVIPARRTGTQAISLNLQKIANVQASASDELTARLAEGKITSTQLTARKRVIAEAFKMYAFPWMTLTEQIYWKEENSENGAKDFQPGIVYYGLPYISGTYYNQRAYNVTKALNENRYYLSSAGNYYILNQNNLYSGKYCGNDCSSMVAQAYTGHLSSLSSWNTHKFYTNTAFTTVSAQNLLPGDILVRDYRHVVMFLYYASDNKNQIVVIEQGGNEPAINTVSVNIYDLSHYLENDYIARRLKAWQ